ncbi:uncharacterized protein LOC109836000 [Asparagus officinalis]|uniref:uncharacterized protein LOC109836000 n=1 Tax=Asparagus officinalis TaxID=4686 RepID=UPI00098DE8FD|nr:uncharacterized protein LOC109836000 [Asparagus officinalis]
MALINLTPKSSLLLLLLFFLFSILLKPGLSARDTHVLPHFDTSLHSKGLRTEGFRRWNARRLLIGSIAPTCTYNECRGCRFKCRSEQVPVDAKDPINSAYRYRCVCHG